jgi:coenzyme F420-reducing hydrogenase gamma subunit
MRKPRLAVFKFTSCDGCQLSLLDCEDELLAIAAEIEVAHFPEASSAVVGGPYDLTLVEGSVTTAHDRERIKQVRRQSRFLVTIGACATAGGIQALRNFRDVRDFVRLVYARPDYIDTLDASTAVAEHVPVDFELPGCPIDKGQLLEVITSFLHGKRPNVPDHALCVDCKKAGIVCLVVSRGVACLGPVTRTGCGVLCPALDRGCYGCFGPKESPNTAPLSARLGDLGLQKGELLRLFRSYNSGAEAFAEESKRHE